MKLFFDTETSNLINFKAPNSDPSQPWVVQLAAILDCPDGPTQKISLIIKSNGLPMSEGAQKVHGITTEMADKIGMDPSDALSTFLHLALQAEQVIAHNIPFDARLLDIMAQRIGNWTYPIMQNFKSIPRLCTMLTTTKLCNLPGPRGPKWPKLEELAKFLFGPEWLAQWLSSQSLHDALVDVELTRLCYYELVRRDHYANDGESK